MRQKRLLERLSELYGISFEKATRLSQQGYRNHNFLVTDSGGQVYNLVVYKREKGILETIKRANYISNFLFSKGYPARASLKTLANKEILTVRSKNINEDLNDTNILCVQHNVVRYAGLYNFLPGNTLPWEGYTMKHIKLLGWVMSDMHNELKAQNSCLPDRQAKVKTDNEISNIIRLAHELKFPMVLDIIKDQMVIMHEYFQTEGVQKAMAKKLGLNLDLNHFYLLGKHMEQIEKDLDILDLQTILHMDLVRGNVLFDRIEEIQPHPQPLSTRGGEGGRSEARPGEGGNQQLCQSSRQSLITNHSAITYNLSPITLTGVIDFEKVAIGPTIVDVSRTLAFLLVDCKYKDEDKIRKYFLESGYEKRGKNSLKEPANQLKYLETLMLFFWLYDFYKFLRHNPYEFLEENEHYERTVPRLLKQKILRHAN